MNRYDVIKVVSDQLGDELVVCNIGHPSQEFFALKDRPQNFYMLGSMGLCSSIGLGLALSQPKRKVVALEGDGAVLMNLGALTTIAHQNPANYTLLIIDNGAHGSTGFQPTFSAASCDLSAMARGAGFRQVVSVNQPGTLPEVFQQAMADTTDSWCVVVKAEVGGAGHHKPLPLTASEIQQRFRKALYDTQ